MWEKRDAAFRWRNLLKGDHLEDLGVDRRVILFWILRRAWASLNWPRMVNSGELL